MTLQQSFYLYNRYTEHETTLMACICHKVPERNEYAMFNLV